MRDPRYDVLFEAVQIGPVRTRNRFYVVPHACGLSHLAPNGAIAFREMKARGGWGVVSTQITEISPDTDLGSHPTERLWDEQDLPYHGKLTERVHAHGALAAIELGHAGVRARNLQTGLPIIGPSVQPTLRPELPFYAAAMTRADIRRFRDQHRRAALLARDAGYDIVYVYAAHDISLLTNFLSRRTNRRSDEYGGSLENRVRLLREVLEDTRDAVGDRCAVALRFGVHEFVSSFAITSDGEGRDVVGLLAELPDLWDVNVSGWSHDSSSSRLSEEGFQEQYTGFVKSMTSKPVVGVGRYTSPDRMVALVRKGVFDLIGAARPSIADPFLPSKIDQGRVDDIRECIGCNHCVATESYGVAIRCTQNPTVNEEWRRGWHPEEVPAAAIPRSVLVVGAGPAGLEYALTAARAGHRVSVCDARDELGGRVVAESRLPGLASWRRLIDYRLYQLRRLPNVDLYPGSRLRAGDIAEFGADQVVLATGARWCRDGVGSTHKEPIEGTSAMPLFTPDDLHDGAALPERVLVYDDDHDYMGSVIAEHLARRGHRVVLATPLAQVSSWTEHKLERDRILAALHGLGVAIRTGASIVRVDAGAVQLRHSPGADVQAVECDAVLLVCARQPVDGMKDELLALSFDPQRLRVIGDALAPGTLQGAVYAGHAAAMEFTTGRAHTAFRRDRACVES